MPERPCRPDPDVQWLWRVFLRDSAPLNCRVTQDAAAAAAPEPAQRPDQAAAGAATKSDRGQ